MATKYWKCEVCEHVGPTETFGEKGYEKCPACGEDNNVFPEREFACCACGFRARQPDFFREEFNKDAWLPAPSDPDPVEEKWDFFCKDASEQECQSTQYVQLK